MRNVTVTVLISMAILAGGCGHKTFHQGSMPDLGPYMIHFDDLDADGDEAVTWAESLNAYPDRAISIEGHTDNRALKQNSRYVSNWELSAARSLAAVYHLQQNNQVDPKRLSVVGYGEFRPVADNETAEGRTLNRRIEIRLLPPS